MLNSCYTVLVKKKKPFRDYILFHFGDFDEFMFFLHVHFKKNMWQINLWPISHTIKVIYFKHLNL